MSELKLCPECGRGHLRPTGEVATDAERSEPFRETGETRKYVCDNPECEMHKSNLVNREYIPLSDIASLEVIKAADIEKMKNNPRLCTSCQKETEIVYNKDDNRLCKECLGNYRSQPS